MANNSNVGRGKSNDQGAMLLTSKSESNLSEIFQVGDDPIVIKAFNLDEQDVVLIEMVAGEGAGRLFSPFCPFNGQSSLDRERNILPIAIPGRYRVVLSRKDDSAPAIGEVSVMYQPATMTHNCLPAYLQPGG